jgi:hypothetical protein
VPLPLPLPLPVPLPLPLPLPLISFFTLLFYFSHFLIVIGCPPYPCFARLRRRGGWSMPLFF